MGKKKSVKIIGKFRGNERGYGFVELEDKTQKDIFIPAQFTGTALNGDQVEVKIIQE